MATRDDPGAALIENKGSGTSLIRDLHREDAVRPIGLLPKGDKITRMSAQSAKIETGYAFLLGRALWLQDFQTAPGIGPWELGARRPRTPIRGRRSFDWTSRAKEALLWGNGPEGCASDPLAPIG